MEKELAVGDLVPHCGMVAVIGRANVGKSTLLNALLSEKVSIVSPVAQTTRNVVRAVLTDKCGQIVFLDTPGVHKSSTGLGKTMNRMARTSVEGVDLIMLVIDASLPPREEDEGWMRRLLFEEAQLMIVLNKQDQNTKHAEAYRKLFKDLADQKEVERSAEWLETSALTGKGVKALRKTLFETMPAGPLLFPPDVLCDFPRLLAIADIIREKYFEVLHHELPHSLAVAIDSIDEDNEDDWNIKGTIYVSRATQKGIVIGKKGRLLRKVTRSSELDIAAIYEKTVKLKLWVKVEKDWSKNHWLLQKFGYRS